MVQYRFLEHTADVKFEAFGKTPNELFRNAALAMCNAMYDTARVKAKESVKIELQAESTEQLLHNFLSEILFQIDSTQLFFGKFKLKIDETHGKLSGEMLGEKIDAKKHAVRGLVKAVSWHQFGLEKQGKQWKCTVIVDV